MQKGSVHLKASAWSFPTVFATSRVPNLPLHRGRLSHGTINMNTSVTDRLPLS